MESVHVSPIDNVYMRVECSDSVSRELYDEFKFLAPNAKYDKRFKSGFWDGYIRSFKRKERLLYIGLIDELKAFCDRNNYEFISDLNHTKKYTYEEVESICDRLNLPFKPYDYQIQAVLEVLNNDCRGLVLSPTGSGKSLIIYILYRIFNKQTLLVVPTKSLVSQMAKDFKSYGYTGDMSLLMEGADNRNPHKLVISTWQSVYNLQASWFEKFKVIFGDEAHGFSSKSMVFIGESSINAIARVGVSGTLTGGDSVNPLVLKGLFGKIIKTKTTKELMKSGQISNLEITAIQLTYNNNDRDLIAKNKPEYIDEIKYITHHERRNAFITGLADRCKGNTLVLFRSIEHGKALYAELKQTSNKQIRMVYGKTELEEREQLRALMEQDSDVIGVCSFKTFATGTNIKNLHNIIFASPVKSQIQVLQSIGRALRLHDTKAVAKLYDIGDCIVKSAKYKNHAWRHFLLRLQYYVKENFTHKIIEVKL